MDENRVSNWGIPTVFAAMGWLALYYASVMYGAQMWLILVAVVATVFSAAALVRFVEYILDMRSRELFARQTSLALTPETVLFREARQLAAQSPELAGQIAQRMGRPDLILFPLRQGKRAQIKLAGSDVTLQFALYVLNRSSDKGFMAERNFGDGTYNFDANHEVTDRQQWMQFNWLLAQDSICTRYVPGQITNRPPEWLPPWTPQKVLENWLIGDLMEVFKPYLQEHQDENVAVEA